MDIKRYDVEERACRVLVHGETVYLSGVAPRDLSGGIEGQTTEALGLIDGFLEKANSNRDRLLNVTVFLKSIEDYSEMNRLWIDWLKGCNKTTRTTVISDLASPDVLIEFSVIAATKTK